MASILSFSCWYSSSTLPLHRLASSFAHVNCILNLKAKPLSPCFSLMASSGDIALQEDSHFTTITSFSPSMVEILSGVDKQSTITNTKRHCRSIHIIISPLQYPCILFHKTYGQWSVSLLVLMTRLTATWGIDCPVHLLAVKRPHRSLNHFTFRCWFVLQLLLVQ